MDFSHDENKTQFLAVCDIFGLPEYVKSAVAEEQEDLSTLQPSAFAGIREYPVHTKAATWMSCAYFTMNEDQLHRNEREFVKSRLEKCAKEWGVDFSGIQKDYCVATAVHEPVKYALVEKDQSENEVKLCPIDTREDVRAAASWLYDNRTKLPYSWRNKIAKAVINEAGDYDGILLPHIDYLNKAAGYGASAPEDIATALAARSRMIDDQQIQDAIMKVAGDLQPRKFNYEAQQKFASLLADIDEGFGITRFYNSFLPLPEETVCGLTAKEASEIVNTSLVLANGRVVTDSALDAMPLHKVAAAIGGAFFETIESTVLPSPSFVKQAVSKLNSDDADTLCLFVQNGLPDTVNFLRA